MELNWIELMITNNNSDMFTLQHNGLIFSCHCCSSSSLRYRRAFPFHKLDAGVALGVPKQAEAEARVAVPNKNLWGSHFGDSNNSSQIVGAFSSLQVPLVHDPFWLSSSHNKTKIHILIAHIFAKKSLPALKVAAARWILMIEPREWTE